MPLALRLASEADIPAMASVGVRAFETDAINVALFPGYVHSGGPSALDDRFDFRVIRTKERMRTPGTISVVVVDDDLSIGDQVVGYAQWESPSSGLPKAASKTAGDLVDDNWKREEYPSTFDSSAFDDLYRQMEVEAHRLFGAAGHRDTWYCIVLGVDPAHRRRGVGTMLANWGVKKAISEGRGCYLVATPSGIPLYSSMGFEDVGRFDLFGVEHCSMLVPPRPVGDPECDN